jgi:hypothetical protein
MMELSPTTLLATLALGLMVVLTGGVAYLTTVEWRDKRRQQRMNQESRTPKKGNRGLR